MEALSACARWRLPPATVEITSGCAQAIPEQPRRRAKTQFRGMVPPDFYKILNLAAVAGAAKLV
jgi:hypothetical protein